LGRRADLTAATVVAALVGAKDEVLGPLSEAGEEMIRLIGRAWRRAKPGERARTAAGAEVLFHWKEEPSKRRRRRRSGVHLEPAPASPFDVVDLGPKTPAIENFVDDDGETVRR